MPTRAGRHGMVYTRHGRLNLRNARFAEDNTPLDPESTCPAANLYSKAYLHHLVRAGEILGMMLLTWNNLSYYQDLMGGLRRAIAEGRLQDFIGETREGWQKAERDRAGVSPHALARRTGPVRWREGINAPPPAARRAPGRTRRIVAPLVHRPAQGADDARGDRRR